MPFTPFHFGPGLLGKGLFTRYYSLTAFILTQIAIDVETLYFMLSGAYPIHRTLHTLMGGAFAGASVALFLIPCRSLFVTLTNRYHWPLLGIGRIADAELSKVGVLVGGIFGGVSHSIFDAIMHPDVRPFQPWSDTNPFLDMVELNMLHTCFIFFGLIGYVLVHYKLRSHTHAD